MPYDKNVETKGWSSPLWGGGFYDGRLIRYICALNDLVQRHGTRNTLILSKNIGIDVVSVDCLTRFSECILTSGNTVQCANDRMDEYLTQMVAGHEMGHDIYHRDSKNDGLRIWVVPYAQPHRIWSKRFAAHILIDTDECLEYARGGYDVVQDGKSDEFWDQSHAD